MAADLTSLTSVLKEWYVGPLADQLNQDCMVTSLLKVNTQDIEGLKAVVPLHYARSGGISSRFEGGTIAQAGKQLYTRATYTLKCHYARVQVSGPSISNTRSDRGAFLQAMKSELDFIRNDVMLDQARQYYAQATGVVATIASVATTVATLTSAEAIYKGYIYIGFVADVGVAANAASVTAANIVTDVDPTVPSVTFTTSVAGAGAGAVIVRSGNVTDTTNAATNAEIDAGLGKLVRAGTVGGIDPTAAGQKFWQGLKVDVTATTGYSPDIALNDLMVHQNQLINAGAKASDITMITTPGLARRLFQTEDFKDQVRFVNQTNLAGGFGELTFQCGNGPMRINTDRLAPWGDVMAIDLQTVQVYSPADWDFLSRDGLTVRWVPDVDAFQSLLFRYINLGTSRRNSSGVLTGYTDTGF